MIHEMLEEKLLSIRVCSEGTMDEALEFIRKNHPAGTINNWQEDKREDVKPVKCRDIPGRTHYVFSC